MAWNSTENMYKSIKYGQLINEGNCLIYKIDDTFENILWEDDEIKSGDKPYRAWTKIKDVLLENILQDYPKLKELFEFAYNWS